MNEPVIEGGQAGQVVRDMGVFLRGITASTWRDIMAMARSWPLRFGNKKGFAVPHNGIIFSENSEKISSH